MAADAFPGLPILPLPLSLQTVQRRMRPFLIAIVLPSALVLFADRPTARRQPVPVCPPYGLRVRYLAPQLAIARGTEIRAADRKAVILGTAAFAWSRKNHHDITTA